MVRRKGPSPRYFGHFILVGNTQGHAGIRKRHARGTQGQRKGHAGHMQHTQYTTYARYTQHTQGRCKDKHSTLPHNTLFASSLLSFPLVSSSPPLCSSSSPHSNEEYKLLIIGEKHVGKSTLTHHLMHHEFHDGFTHPRPSYPCLIMSTKSRYVVLACVSCMGCVDCVSCVGCVGCVGCVSCVFRDAMRCVACVACVVLACVCVLV